MTTARNDSAKGLLVVGAILLVLGVVLSYIPSCQRAWNREVDQVRRTQEFRKTWNRNCVERGGQIVTNGKGSPSYLCFGPDGRLLGTR